MGGSPRKRKKAPADFQVRIGEDEMGRIFHLRDTLDQSETLIQHADHYRELNWVLEARGEGVPTLDFSQASEIWGERLMTLALAGVEVELRIKTGLFSRLLVLETPQGDTLLDTYGEWRSSCRARAGENWEQHYFTLSPASRVPISGKVEDYHVRIYGQDGLVLAPPSRREGEDGQFWTWLAPPWELPPPPLGPSVWEFLEDFGLLREAEELDLAGQVLSWDQVYALIAPHEEVIRTLLTPNASVTDYYRELAQQARQAGIKDPDVLFALLWHAPQGDVRNSPDRLPLIRELSAVETSEEASGKKIAKKRSSPASQPKEAPAQEAEPQARSQPAPNDLVEFMENRVVLDLSRYESMIYELAELTAKAEALQRRLDEWERRYQGSQPSKAAEPQVFQAPPQEPREFPFDPPVEAPPPRHKRKPLSSLKTVVQEFLKNNTDLAVNDESVRMLQFCLRNYIDLNPELNGLPLGEKLEMAGKMAREFMTQVSHRGA
jgi:chemotaxis protein histidine kinase CheA